MIGEGAEVVGRQPAKRLLIVARDHQNERKQNADQQNPKQAAGQGDHPHWAGTGRAFMASSRCGSSAMSGCARPSLYAVQRPISSRLRPQPRQSPDGASTMQICSQGVSMAAMVRA